MLELRYKMTNWLKILKNWNCKLRG
jgi:hypothetical protein